MKKTLLVLSVLLSCELFALDIAGKEVEIKGPYLNESSEFLCIKKLIKLKLSDTSFKKQQLNIEDSSMSSNNRWTNYSFNFHQKYKGDWKMFIGKIQAKAIETRQGVKCIAAIKNTNNCLDGAYKVFQIKELSTKEILLKEISKGKCSFGRIGSKLNLMSF